MQIVGKDDHGEYISLDRATLKDFDGSSDQAII